MMMLVVIAEDDEILAKALKEKFEAEGFKVLVVKDGQEAVDILKGSPKPDLILLDLIMPVKDGFAVLEEMAQNVEIKIRSIPVIVLSNLGEDESIKRALKLGATDYLVKSQHSLSEVVQRVKKIQTRSYFA